MTLTVLMKKNVHIHSKITIRLFCSYRLLLLLLLLLLIYSTTISDESATVQQCMKWYRDNLVKIKFRSGHV